MTQQQTHTATEAPLSNLNWPLVVALGAVGLLRPALGISGYGLSYPWLTVLVPLVITAVWVGVVVARREPRPVATLVGAGGVYAVLTVALMLAFGSLVSGLLPVAVVAVFAIDLLWGAIAGGIAMAIQRLRR